MAITPQKKPRYVLTVISLTGSKKVSVYAGQNIKNAFAEISSSMKLYKGVRLSQVLEAVYKQGKKDGARDVFEQVDGLKADISHRNPGQPKKKRLKGKKRKRR